MKKEYMKPVMESETFVANEYVATCTKVSCGAEFFWMEGKPQDDFTWIPFNGDKDDFDYLDRSNSLFLNGKDYGWYYKGDKFSHEGKYDIRNNSLLDSEPTYVKCHKVTIETKENGTGPNAS